MRLIKKGYWILAMVVFTGWQSCVPDNKDKDVVIQVDDEYTINMVESLSNNRQLLFELESIDMEPCLNSSIDRAVVVEEGKISLFINGIVAAVDCTPGMAPATSTGNAGTLQNGIYDFVITIRNTIENRGKLIVRNDDYEINMITENGIIILHNTLYRIPDQTIWGYVAYDDADLVGPVAENFLNDLTIRTSPSQLHEGYYGIFQIDNNGQLTLRNPPQKNEVRTFHFKYVGTETELEALLESYRSAPGGDEAELVIFTSIGSQL